MAIPRFVRITVALLLALGIAAGFYLYQNLETILQQQVMQALEDFGVQGYRLDQPGIGTDQFSAGQVWLQGEYEDHTYEIAIDQLAIQYSWRSLLTGQAENIRLSRLDITANRLSPSTAPADEPAGLDTRTLLPEELLDALPARRLDIAQWNLSYSAPDLGELALQGSLVLHEELEASLAAALAGADITGTVRGTASSLAGDFTVSETGNIFAQLSAHVEQLSWNEMGWRLQGAWHHAPLLDWLRRLPTGNNAANSSALPEDLMLRGSGEFSAQLRHPADLLVPLPPEWSDLEDVTARLRASSTVEQLAYPQMQYTLEQLAVDAEVNLQPGNTLETRATGHLESHLAGQSLPPLNFSLEQHGPITDSALQLELEDATQAVNAQLAGTLDLVSGEGALNIDLRSPNLSSLGEALLPPLGALELVPAGIVIEQGALELHTQLKTRSFDPDHWQQHSRLALTDMSGLYDEYRFSRLSLSGEWTGMTSWRTSEPLAFSLDHLNVGFDITDIRGSIALPRATPLASPNIRVDSLSANLFGGRAFLPEPTNWDVGASSNTATLKAEQWQLSQIVALQQSEDISARGILEGELPVTVTDGRLIIEKGYLRALPPGGAIRYIANDASEALGQNSQQLAMALGLLSDFRYELLSSAVELDDDGNLLLGLSLEGHNPDQYEGRPVKFNINLEQNLYPLLQSLRLSGKLTEEIENRLQ